MCVLTAPEVFDQDDEGDRVVLLTSEPAPGLRGQMADAVVQRLASHHPP